MKVKVNRNKRTKLVITSVILSVNLTAATVKFTNRIPLHVII